LSSWGSLSFSGRTLLHGVSKFLLDDMKGKDHVEGPGLRQMYLVETGYENEVLY
jgi:hypothetical protein